MELFTMLVIGVCLTWMMIFGYLYLLHKRHSQEPGWYRKFLRRRRNE